MTDAPQQPMRRYESRRRGGFWTWWYAIYGFGLVVGTVYPGRGLVLGAIALPLGVLLLVDSVSERRRGLVMDAWGIRYTEYLRERVVPWRAVSQVDIDYRGIVVPGARVQLQSGGSFDIGLYFLPSDFAVRRDLEALLVARLDSARVNVHT